MDEIEVVVDVRQSADSPELIVVKQKFGVAGTVQLLGSPTEQRFLVSTQPAENNGRTKLPARNSVGQDYHSSRYLDNLRVNPQAQIPFNTLSKLESDQLLQAVWSLRGLDPGHWPPEKVKLLATNGTPTYLLYVSDELRAFITPVPNGQIELVDIVHKDTLKLFQDDE